MKYLTKPFSVAWKFLDGKKTNISAAFWLFYVQVVPVIWANGIPESYDSSLRIIATLLTLAGLGHKITKKSK